MGALQGKRTVLSACFGRREMAHPMPTKAFLKLSPDTAMLFAPT